MSAHYSHRHTPTRHLHKVTICLCCTDVYVSFLHDIERTIFHQPTLKYIIDSQTSRTHRFLVSQVSYFILIRRKQTKYYKSTNTKALLWQNKHICLDTHKPQRCYGTCLTCVASSTIQNLDEYWAKLIEYTLCSIIENWK